jgi:hypothetical protein
MNNSEKFIVTSWTRLHSSDPTSPSKGRSVRAITATCQVDRSRVCASPVTPNADYRLFSRRGSSRSIFPAVRQCLANLTFCSPAISNNRLANIIRRPSGTQTRPISATQTHLSPAWTVLKLHLFSALICSRSAVILGLYLSAVRICSALISIRGSWHPLSHCRDWLRPPAEWRVVVPNWWTRAILEKEIPYRDCVMEELSFRENPLTFPELIIGR